MDNQSIIFVSRNPNLLVDKGSLSLYCPRCSHTKNKVKMKASKRSFHKKTKFLCPNCGLIKMKPH